MSDFMDAPTPSLENADPNAYTVAQGTNLYNADTRDDAVVMAKQLSADNRQRVSVSANDGTIKMQFRDGDLETYVFQTRRD
jgi:hypothetical protein